MKTKAFAFLPVLIGIAVVGVAGLFVAKPKFLHGDSRRAAASTEATAAVDAAVTKQGAEAAASVVKIGEANATAPDSKEKDFIAREVPVALAKLPAPDAQALIEAERRKAAVLAGQLEAVSRLYDQALKRADVLERERAAALAERRAADLRLEQAAAEALGAERTRNGFIFCGVLAVGLYLYVKLTHFSPSAIAEAVADIKAGVHPITALDTVAGRLQQRLVNFLGRLKAR